VITKDKPAEIAADFMTTFYHIQIGSLETQEVRRKPTPFWQVCFFGHDQGTATATLLRRDVAGWEDCGAERKTTLELMQGHRPC
jgi:hypothetical protein